MATLGFLTAGGWLYTPWLTPVIPAAQEQRSGGSVFKASLDKKLLILHPKKQVGHGGKLR
jgi:hypothetical protein